MIAPRHPGASKVTVATGLAGSGGRGISSPASKFHLPSQHSLRMDLEQQPGQGPPPAAAAAPRVVGQTAT